MSVTLESCLKEIADSKSPEEREESVVCLASEACYVNKVPARFLKQLKTDERSAVVSAMPPNPYLKYILDNPGTFSALEKVRIVERCVFLGSPDRAFDADTFNDPAWAGAVECAKELQSIDYNAHSSLDFGRGPGSFRKSYHSDWDIEYRKIILRRLCSNEGRCGAEMIAAIATIVESLGDEEWTCVRDHYQLGYADLPGSAMGPRMRELFSYAAVRSADTKTAITGAIKFGIDPLHVRGANPLLVRFSQTIRSALERERTTDPAPIPAPVPPTSQSI